MHLLTLISVIFPYFKLMKIDFPEIKSNRIYAIDIIRALTMILMIFVNDLWSLKDIPSWLGHVERGVDGMGLADTVFPAFLFIVGLSLPYAIDARRKKGDTEWQLILHVVVRSLALLIMGVFLVNGETINASGTGTPRFIWNTICCLSFILIWNQYSEKDDTRFVFFNKLLAVVSLLCLAYYYRGGKDDALTLFSPQWWGILGLIGWAYLAAGIITVLSRNNLFVILAGWLVFAIISMVSHAGLFPESLHFIPDAIRGGTLAGLSMGGVLTSFIFQYFRNKNDHQSMYLVLSVMAGLLTLASILVRPYWGLAKLGATPAWLFLCSALTLILFLFIYWLVDIKGKSAWFDFVRPAGTNTLLCYLIPYFSYAFMRLFHLHLPAFLLNGVVGLIKSLGFALLCVFITGRLAKGGIKLKL